MRRRTVISHEMVNQHSHTPQKMRTIPHTKDFQDSLFYMRGQYKPTSGAEELDRTQLSWIGKFYIPEGKRPSNPRLRNYVYELEIAKYSRSFEFRVLYLRPGCNRQPNFMARSTGINTASKPIADYRPARMNIYLDTRNIIRGIGYF